VQEFLLAGEAIDTRRLLLSTIYIDASGSSAKGHVSQIHPTGPQIPVIFATTHLDYTNDTVRADEAESAVEAISSYTRLRNDTPIVFVGDMNEDVNGTGRVGPILTMAGFIDGLCVCCFCQG